MGEVIENSRAWVSHCLNNALLRLPRSSPSPESTKRRLFLPSATEKSFPTSGGSAHGAGEKTQEN